VKRALLRELYYITAIQNVASMMQRGILCHNLSPVRKPVLISNAEVQQRRAHKTTPSGQPLHDYANLYFTARNPMMYVSRDKHLNLCVLRINPKVIENADEAFVTDGNAASKDTAIWQATEGIEKINASQVFAEYWTHTDEKIEQERKRIKCAEVLIYKLVPPRFVKGAFVSCQQSRNVLTVQVPTLPVTIKPDLFFLDGARA
jgi:hypothetical protein